MSLESIRSLVGADLHATDEFIISHLESNIPLIREVIEYVLSCGGKRVRPMVLLLCARALNEHGQKRIDLAAVVELIHTATLLHDDVVDDSTLRRSHQTANTIWGNDTSVLVGDFLYSRAFQIVVNQRHQQILDIFAGAMHFIAEGEIMQLTNCNNPDTTEAFYYEVIERKTARLFEVAAQLGALIATDSTDQVEAMRQYGLHLGLAYQLIDDAIDYGSAELAGKNVGQDITEGKTTLPLIHAMRQSHNTDLALLKNAIKTGVSDNLEQILGIIESTQAIKYTADAAKKHAQLAKNALAGLPNSVYKQALEDLCDFVVERSY